MTKYWLKLIGFGVDPGFAGDDLILKEGYPYNWIDFPEKKRPSGWHVGDGVILYASGSGSKIFAEAKVTSEIKDATWPKTDPDASEKKKRFPHRMEIEFTVNLPPPSGVDIAEIDASRALRNKIRWGPSYFELKPTQYRLAADKLSTAERSRARNRVPPPT